MSRISDEWVNHTRAGTSVMKIYARRFREGLGFDAARTRYINVHMIESMEPGYIFLNNGTQFQIEESDATN